MNCVWSPTWYDLMTRLVGSTHLSLFYCSQVGLPPLSVVVYCNSHGSIPDDFFELVVVLALYQVQNRHPPLWFYVVWWPDQLTILPSHMWGTGMITRSSTFCLPSEEGLWYLSRLLHALLHGTEALVYSNHPREAAASTYLASCVPWFLHSTAVSMQLLY